MVHSNSHLLYIVRARHVSTQQGRVVVVFLEIYELVSLTTRMNLGRTLLYHQKHNFTEKEVA